MYIIYYYHIYIYIYIYIYILRLILILSQFFEERVVESGSGRSDGKGGRLLTFQDFVPW